MKGFLAIAALVAGLGILPAASQGSSDAANATELFIETLTPPECMINCLASSLLHSSYKIRGNDTLNDGSINNVTCICTNAELSQSVGSCLLSNCTTKDFFEAQDWEANMCKFKVRDRSAVTRKVMWPLFGIAALAVAFRFHARSSLLKGAGFGWDDWTILLSLVLLAAGDATLDEMTQSGLGKDIWTLPYGEVTRMLHVLWAQEFVYIAVLATTKISILLLYLRIFPNTISNWFRIGCFVLIGSCVAYCIAIWGSILFACNPIDWSWTHWEESNRSKHCISGQPAIYATAGINIVLDMFVFFLPIPKLVKFNISYGRRAGVCLTFLVGLFVTICSAVRLRYLARWGSSSNPSWDYVGIAIWSALESNLAVFCACMPMMAGPLKRLARKAGWGRNSRSASRSTGSITSSQCCDDSELGKITRMPTGAISKTVEMSMISNDRRSSFDADAMDLEKQYYPGPPSEYLSQNTHIYSA